MSERFREGVVNAVWYLGMNNAFRACLHSRRRLLILCYHGVVQDEQAQNPVLYGNVIGVSEFTRQMRELTRQFRPITASELWDWRSGKGSVPRNAALVTFDDGYRNNLTCAASVLLRLGIPALINISAGYIGQKLVLWPDEIHWRVAFWPDRFIPMPAGQRERMIPVDFSARLVLATHLRESCKRLPPEQLASYLARLREANVPEPSDELYGFLSWDEVRTLKKMGFDIGSHTVNHSILTQLTRDECERELKNSKRIIEDHTKCECAYFAYPNGGPDDVSPEVVEGIRSAGYSFAFTVMNQLASATDDPFLLARVYIPGGISMADYRSRISGLRGLAKQCLAFRRNTLTYGAYWS